MSLKLGLIIGAAALAVATAPAAAQPRGDEPIAVPRNIKQGIDFVYVDPDLSNVARRHQRPQNWLRRILNFDFSGRGQRNAPNPLFVELGRGLQQYQASWGRLPQTAVPAGPTLRQGSTGRRVDALRTRLGLPPGGGYDQRLFETVSAYQRVHGLTPVDGIAGRQTIASLNRGADHYARRIAINVERAFRLPNTRTFDRYVVVDSGAAAVYLFDNDRVVDGMKAIVGSPEHATPMLAVIMRNAKANPYWHVPPDMIRTLTARRVLSDGVSYLKNFHYEVLSDWGPNPRLLDPKEVNWRQVAAGRSDILVRQLPGPWNSMGNMKFEMPNDYGIYLHDTPRKELFAQDNRWISNGCVRLEDYRRFATWVFGSPPQSSRVPEQKIDLPRPVPVFLTYLTVSPTPGGVVFRPDPYGFDAQAMPQMFGPGRAASAGDAARGQS